MLWRVAAVLIMSDSSQHIRLVFIDLCSQNGGYCRMVHLRRSVAIIGHAEDDRRRPAGGCSANLPIISTLVLFIMKSHTRHTKNY